MPPFVKTDSLAVSEPAVTLGKRLLAPESSEEALARQDALQEIMDMALFGDAAEIEALAELLKNPIASRAAFLGAEYPKDLHRTPLLAALASNRAEAAWALLPHSDLGAVSNRGQTPLMMAVNMGDAGLVKAIVSRPESRPNAQGVQGMTAIAWAVDFTRPDRPDLVEALLPFSDAHITTCDVTMEGTQQLFPGWTPLMLAAYTGKPKSLALLLPASDLFAQVHADKRCALALAIENKKTDCVGVLLAQDHSRAPAGYWRPLFEVIMRQGDVHAMERILPQAEVANSLEIERLFVAVSKKLENYATPENSECVDLLAVSVDRAMGADSWFGSWDRQWARLFLLAEPARYPRFNAVFQARELAAAVSKAHEGPGGREGVKSESAEEGPANHAEKRLLRL